MGKAAQLYAQELGVLAHGHPMWCPEPMGPYEVRVGDVGFIDEDGQFHRLFNATVGGEHPYNQHGVPEGFQPLGIQPHLINIRPNHLPQGPISSSSVKSYKVDASGSTGISGVASGQLSYSFDCSTTRGAILVLVAAAKKTYVPHSNSMTSYMGKNHASWYRFATNPNQLGLELSPEDIVMVRGTIKTASWGVGAYINNGDTSHGVSFTAQMGQLAEASFEWSFTNQISAQFYHREGGLPRHPLTPPLCSNQEGSQRPDELELPEVLAERNLSQTAGDHSSTSIENKDNQCVFLNYYKIKHRLTLWQKIAVAVGSSNFLSLGRRQSSPRACVNSETGSVFELPATSKSSQDQTPVDDLLDYILEASDAILAVGSDYEVVELLQRKYMPEDFRSFLRRTKPRISVDDHGSTFLARHCLALFDSS
ncbi:hypothetical protein EIP86_000054 [Pleurotus ostreatoroseus]|nr:hypothetical protein EIP86_000054 [Pleurotus ostreatoroseus]